MEKNERLYEKQEALSQELMAARQELSRIKYQMKNHILSVRLRHKECIHHCMGKYLWMRILTQRSQQPIWIS